MKKNIFGDTIVEVLLAMSILTLILFTSWGLVNRSTQVSLAARKRVEMVNQLKEQAELLKYKYQKNDGDGANLLAELQQPPISSSSNNSLAYLYINDEFCSEPASLSSTNRFYIDSKLNYQVGTKPFNDDLDARTWIEYKDVFGEYTDFYVRGCWRTPGGKQKLDNSQFIVRLNR